MNRPSAHKRPDAPLLVAYFPLNDPLIPMATLDHYVGAGVDVVELGLKARDPILDGPVVRRSMQRSRGTGRVGEAHAAAQYLRDAGRGDVLGTLFCYPEDTVCEAEADWDALDALLCLATDPTRHAQIVATAQARATQRVEFLGYTWDEAGLDRARGADCYVMLQYCEGQTGPRQTLDRGFSQRLAQVRRAGVTVPIVTGIGISTPQQVRHAMDCGADGIVTGSKVITLAEAGGSGLPEYLSQMRGELDGG